MVDQFVAEKCLHAASTDNKYFDNRSDPRTTPRQFRWYKSPGPGLKIGANPGGCPGGCLCLELIDALQN